MTSSKGDQALEQAPPRGGDGLCSWRYWKAKARGLD